MANKKSQKNTIIGSIITVIILIILTITLFILIKNKNN